MKHSLVLLILLCGSSLHAQFSYQPFDPSQDIQNTIVKKQVPGCACAYTVMYPQLKDIQVSPTSVQTTVGQSVQIRYDASGVCMGQTVRNSNGQTSAPYGTARWEVGAMQDLPDTYGIISFTGYNQPK